MSPGRALPIAVLALALVAASLALDRDPVEAKSIEEATRLGHRHLVGPSPGAQVSGSSEAPTRSRVEAARAPPPEPLADAECVLEDPSTELPPQGEAAFVLLGAPGETGSALLDIVRSGEPVGGPRRDCIVLGREVTVEALAAPGGLVVPLEPGTYEWAVKFDAGSSLRSTSRATIHVESARRTVAAAIADRSHEIVSGQVVDARGKPVEGVLIVATAEGETRVAATDAGGRFEVRGLGPGAVELFPDVSSMQRRTFAYFGTFEQPSLFLPRPQRDLAIALEDGYTICARVVDSSGAAPPESRFVEIDRARTAIPRRIPVAKERAASGEPTRLCTIHHLRAGPYTLRVYDPTSGRYGPPCFVAVRPETARDRVVECMLLAAAN